MRGSDRRTPKAMGQLGWYPQWENTQRPYYIQGGWQGWQTLLTSTHVLWYIHVHIYTYTYTNTYIVNTHAYNKCNFKNSFLVASSTTYWTCFPPPDSDVVIVETAEATKNLVLRNQVEGTWFAWPLHWSVPRLFNIYMQKPCWVLSSLFYKRFQ